MTQEIAVQQQEAFSLAPKNLEQALQYAKLLAESTVVPVAFQKKPADILIAVQLGMELGFSPVQALQSIAVINGRPCVWGQGVAARIISSPLCEYLKLPTTDEIRSTHKAIVVAKRKGHPEVVGTFDDADAKQAGLGSKDTYAKWWPDMYLWRAFHRATKITFADVMKGLLPREIMDDFEPFGTTPQGYQLQRKPRRIDEPSSAEVKVEEAQIAEFLKPPAPAPTNGHKAAPAAKAEPEVGADGAEKVGVIKSEEGTIQSGARKGEKFLKVTLARSNGSSLDASCFSTTAAKALRDAEGAGLPVWIKTETRAKDGKQYVNVTEAVVEDAGSPE